MPQGFEEGFAFSFMYSANSPYSINCWPVICVSMFNLPVFRFSSLLLSWISLSFLKDIYFFQRFFYSFLSKSRL